jgi:hypothetical protein
MNTSALALMLFSVVVIWGGLIASTVALVRKNRAEAAETVAQVLSSDQK